VYFMCEPLPRTLSAALETATSDIERRAVLQSRQGGYSSADAKRVLAFGGVSALLLDRTTGVSVTPIADSLVLAFKELADNGVLAQQQALVGVALVLVDCRFHADAKHRAPGDIVPAATRAMSAALLATAAVRLLEPELRAEVSCDTRVVNDVYSTLHRRGAACTGVQSSASQQQQQQQQQEQRFVTIGATISVRQSLGIVGDLRGATKGAAFVSLSPLGWRLVASDACDAHSDAGQLVSEARMRARLTATVPTAADYEDRL